MKRRAKISQKTFVAEKLLPALSGGHLPCKRSGVSWVGRSWLQPESDIFGSPFESFSFLKRHRIFLRRASRARPHSHSSSADPNSVSALPKLPVLRHQGRQDESVHFHGSLVRRLSMHNPFHSLRLN